MNAPIIDARPEGDQSRSGSRFDGPRLRNGGNRRARPAPAAEVARTTFSCTLGLRYDTKDPNDTTLPIASTPTAHHENANLDAPRRLFVVWVTPGSASPADEKPSVPPDHARRMQEGLVLFKAKVRPVLEQHCLNCHGGKATKGDLDLSDREPLMKSGVLEGGSKESRLAVLIRHEDDPHMPQKAPKLPEATIADIGRWIDLGAPYDRPLVDRGSRSEAIGRPTSGRPNFWSFRPLAGASPPRSRDGAWVRTPIDRFIAAALETRGLKPNPIADRRTLIRRLDVRPDRIAPVARGGRCVRRAIRSPDAYERLVDRLLASPHFGERFARHWMDVARFAESHGYEQDYDRPYRLPLPRLPDPGLQRRHAVRPVRPLAARRRRVGARRSAWPWRRPDSSAPAPFPPS